MLNSYKAALLASLGLAGAVTAQAATYNGDLLIGFTTQSGNDTIIDLGAASSLSDGEIFNFSSLLGSSDLSTINWGILGDRNISGTRTAWSTLGGVVSGTGTWNSMNVAAGSIYQNFATAGAGQSLVITSTDDNSWNQQTINGALTSQYVNLWGNPNSAGLVSETLYQMVANGSDPVALGAFTLNANGTVMFSAAAVPEPATYSLLGGTGLLLVSLRSRLRRKVS